MKKDPREDLNGLDVARKVVILARLTGQNIELEDVTVENIVPPALMRVSMDEFSSQLPSYDQDFKAKLMDAKQKGKVLRCIYTPIYIYIYINILLFTYFLISKTNMMITRCWYCRARKK